ncbi:hypothetical protein FSP39_023491 [Pinctada imbricata]|uniref:Cadherin domain-containing protein n=1 Tax=Pinctada imbricata TaxID=66713 RepID=A0AA88XGP5_PINIB|nr:hypothetical protein FSP39_023491 [Pinctada imbricata]
MTQPATCDLRLTLTTSLVNGPTKSRATCGNNDYIGENDPKSKDNEIDSGTGLGILLDADDNEFTFDCCGRVDSWEIYAENSGTVQLQVWRNSGGTWTLRGQNSYTVAVADAQSEILIPIASNEQISVDNGDVIGIYTSGTPIVTYKNEGGGGGGNNNYYLDYTVGSLSVGAAHTWSSRQGGRDYAVKALLSGDNSPTFSGNLPDTVTFPDTTASGTLVKTIQATDADALDTLVYTMTTTTSSFSFDTNTLQLTSVGALPSSAATSTTTLSFQVTDDCGNTDTSSLKVVVTNSVPVIHNLPSSFDVSEDQTAELLLLTLSVTDASLADTVTCTLPSVSPSTSNFLLKVISGTSDYGIYIKASPTLDYDTISSYTLTISCSDTKESATGTFSVYILRNSPPTINNLGNAVVAFIPTTTTNGDLIYTVSSTDPEGDTLSYNMTCSVNPCPFHVMNSGQVLSNTNFASLTTAGYDLYIYVFDGKTLVGPETLTVVVSDINSDPEITNLPLSSSIAVSENTALGTSIYQITAYDANVNDNLVYSATYTPSSSSGYFTLDSTGLLTTFSNILNFESLTSTTVTIVVTVSDSTSSDTANLVLTIVDVNEPPQFDRSKYSISGNEGSAGTVVGNPPFVVTDPDNGASLTYSISCPEFSMNPATAEVSFAATYDLDISGTSNVVICNTSVTDGEFDTTAELEITILDVNDNRPNFAFSNYVFYAQPNMAVGTVLGNIVATDADFGNNGNVLYSLDQSSLSTPYFGVQSNGDFYVTDSLLTFSTGHTLSISGTASDPGGLTDTCTITIVIPQSTTTTQGTTSERYISFIEDTRNVAWLTVLILCFAAIAVVVTIVAVKAYRCGDLFKSCKYLNTESLCSADRNELKINHPRILTNLQIGQRIRTQSPLTRFKQGLSWSPVVMVGQCELCGIRLYKTVDWSRTMPSVFVMTLG